MKKKTIIYKLDDLQDLYKSTNAISNQLVETENYRGSINSDHDFGLFRFDISNQQITEINIHAKSIFNCGDYQISKNGLETLYTQIHQEDLPKIIFLEARFFQLILELSSDLRTKAKMEYHFRIKTDNGYKWYLRRIKILSCDKNGKPSLQSNIIVEINNVKNEESVIGYIDHPIEGAVRINAGIAINGGNAPISDRENEILEKLSRGMLSKDVADHFCLSPETVHRHRKKILKKLNANNMIEAIYIAKNKGLL